MLQPQAAAAPKAGCGGDSNHPNMAWLTTSMVWGHWLERVRPTLAGGGKVSSSSAGKWVMPSRDPDGRGAWIYPHLAEDSAGLPLDSFAREADAACNWTVGASSASCELRPRGQACGDDHTAIDDRQSPLADDAHPAWTGSMRESED